MKCSVEKHGENGRHTMGLWLLLVLFVFAFAPSRAFRRAYGQEVCLSVSDAEAPVVQTSVEILRHDWQQVLGVSPSLAGTSSGTVQVIVGTRGMASLDGCGVKLDELEGKTQAYLLAVNGRDQLVVAGSDSWGTAYGIVELTRLLGVSAWEWWADVTPRKLKEFRLKRDFRTEVHEPSVRYRGIFINDEDWGLMPWSYQTMEPGQPKGTIGPKTTARIFELMLRLKANLYWPPMHECSRPFFMTPGNREMAEKYGMFIGTSHCEPLACNVANEWRLRGHGAYDYVNNKDSVLDFWNRRVKDVARQPVVYTLGMRGVHDGAMQGVKNSEEGKTALADVIAKQRDMLLHEVVDSGRNPFGYRRVEDVPQVFVPYKEVLDIYHEGLQVPDEATLVWCDDNYGYVRHFPDAKERARKGGNGIYYHVSYWGRPHDYLWLGTFSPGLMAQQMTQAYREGVQRLWVLNVGDIKPAEYQIQLFLDMAWDIRSVAGHQNRFMTEIFGARLAPRLTDLMQESYRLALVRKPEMMGNTRTEEWDRKYSVVKDLPWTESQIRKRLDDYQCLEDLAEKLAAQVPADRQEAFFQLVKYPVQAASQMNKKILYAQLARHGRADWSRSDAAYDSIQTLTAIYNEGLDKQNKWKGIMDAAPRRLAVFARICHESATDSLPADATLPFFTLSGQSLKGEGVKALGMPLGYADGAVQLVKDVTVVCDLRKCLKSLKRQGIAPADSIDIAICLLPTHSQDGGRLALKAWTDGQELSTLDYTTQGRSEEWKENVLANRTVRCIRVAVAALKAGARLHIRALDGNVVLDQIQLYRSGAEKSVAKS